MKAVILAAGQGSRLLPLTETRPKCLVELSGRSLLQWQLEALAVAGVREAVVVTGFGAEQVDSMLESGTPDGITVRTFYNPFYAQADNLATCWLVREELTGGTLILNGDTLLEPKIAEVLLAAPPAPITVTVDRKERYDSDDMKVQVDGSRLLAIGKTLPDEIVGAESIGFLRFDARGAALFREEVERTMRTPQGLKLWYLSAIHRLAQAGADVRIASIEGLQWGEMDFPADVARNRAMTANWARWLPRASLATAAAR
jgi:choline kinase